MHCATKLQIISPKEGCWHDALTPAPLCFRLGTGPFASHYFFDVELLRVSAGPVMERVWSGVPGMGRFNPRALDGADPRTNRRPHLAIVASAPGCVPPRRATGPRSPGLVQASRHRPVGL